MHSSYTIWFAVSYNVPQNNWVNKLIVKHYHELGNYIAVTNQILTPKFWIIAAREAILEWEKECAICQKRKAKKIMAPLSLNRLTMLLRAFIKVAVDFGVFGGPFMTVHRQKRYLCLFTCLASRAVHLKMVYGLDVNCFWMHWIEW